MIRFVLILSLAFVSQLPADAFAAEGVSRARARAIAREEARRSYNSQRTQDGLGLGAGSQSVPMTSAPAQSGSFNASGQYRSGSGTVVVPNR